MKFQFDAHQEFQLAAVGAITGLFEGQRRHGLELSFELGGIPAVPNVLELSKGELLIKRSMYGRAKFDLLRKRVLGLPVPA